MPHTEEDMYCYGGYVHVLNSLCILIFPGIFFELELQQLVKLLVCPHMRMHRRPVLRR